MVVVVVVVGCGVYSAQKLLWAAKSKVLSSSGGGGSVRVAESLNASGHAEM